jgi:hypothetical protein
VLAKTRMQAWQQRHCHLCLQVVVLLLLLQLTSTNGSCNSWCSGAWCSTSSNAAEPATSSSGTPAASPAAAAAGAEPLSAAVADAVPLLLLLLKLGFFAAAGRLLKK